jgi:hypothetical protein
LAGLYKPKLDGKSNRTGIKNGLNAKKTGPKPKPIDWNEVRKLGEIHCTVAEVAGFLELSEDALDRRYKIDFPGEGSFGDYLLSFRNKGKTSIRRSQYNLAVNEGNVPMLIHLGKYYLDQRDIPVETKIIENNIVITEENVDEWLNLAK